MLGFGVRHDRKTFSSSNPIKIDELKIVEWEEGHDIPGFSTSVLDHTFPPISPFFGYRRLSKVLCFLNSPPGLEPGALRIPNRLQ